jgi:hypothetical protein
MHAGEACISRKDATTRKDAGYLLAIQKTLRSGPS